MGQRWMPWLLAAMIAVIGLLVVRGCSSRGGDRKGDATPPTASDTAAVLPGNAKSDSAADAASAAVARRRTEAIYAAIGTLQRYLAALGSDDRIKADAFWADARASPSGESDLRTLKALRELRIETGTPKPLDADDVPAALEIPVNLRVSVKGAPMARYAGWYRLRRAVSGDRWEITSASVDLVPRAQ